MKNKRFLSLVLCFVLVASLFTGFVSTASADDVITHTVKNNEYLFKICKAYGLDYYQCKNAIMILNGYTSETQLNRLSVGQVIKLPATNAIAATVKGSSSTTTIVETSTTVNGVTKTTTSASTVSGVHTNYSVSYYLIPHVVKSGETLASICNTYGTSYAQYSSMIMAINSISSPNYVWAGKTIYVPSSKAPASGSCYAVVAHTVKSGETLTSICNSYGTNYAANSTIINGLNGSKAINTIYAGQTLYIPVVATVSGGSGYVTPTPTVAPATTGYKIGFNNPANGNPVAVVDNVSGASRADAGKTVTILPNPETGYALKSIKVVRNDSNTNVEVVSNSFIMPSSNVTVTVTYAEGYKLTKVSSSNGTFETFVNGSVGTSAFYGDEVVLAISPRYDYAISEVRYQKANGSLAAVVVKPDEYGVYSFSMPNYNVKITVTFSLAAYHTLKLTKTGQGTATFTQNDVAVTKAAEGEVVVLNVAPTNGWVIKDGFPQIASGASELKDLGNGKYSFKVNSGFTGNVEIKVEFRNAISYSFAADGVAGGYVTFTVTDAITGTVTRRAGSAKPGDVVEIVAYPNKDYTYNAANTKNFVTLANAGSILPSGNWIIDGIKFTMPEANVRVIPQFDKAPSTTYYGVGIQGSGYGSAECRINSATGTEQYNVLPGTDVFLVITPNSNYKVDYVQFISDNGWVQVGSSTVPASSYENTERTIVKVKMPEHYTEFAVTYKLGYDSVPLNTPTADGGIVNNLVRMLVNGQEISGNAIVGTTITLNYELKSNYEIKKITKTGGSGDKELTVTNGAYSYTITAADFSSGSPVSFTVETKNVTPKYKVLYSDPTAGTYDVYINNVKASNYNLIEAYEGDTIKLEAEPYSGYELGQIIVDNMDIAKGDITYVGSKAVYEFVMPAWNVKTQVTFKAVYTPTMYSITGAGTGVTWSSSNPTTASEGATIVLKYTYGTAPTSVTVTGVDSAKVQYTTVVDGDGNFQVSFPMPGQDVTVTVS